jgi:hypothetical protein
MVIPGVAQGQFFFDDFDSYTAGSTIAGQNGWEAWGGSAAADAFVVNNQSHSSPNSLAVNGSADIVHQFSGVTSGMWYAKVWTYVPSTQSGTLYFIMLNRYDGVCANAGDCNWSVQISMSNDTGLVTSEGGTDNPSSAAPLPLITDQWVEILVEFDLTGLNYTVYYGGTFLDNLPWTISGDINLAAIDLFSDNSSESYMDDVWIDTTVPVELQSLSVD